MEEASSNMGARPPMPPTNDEIKELVHSMILASTNTKKPMAQMFIEVYRHFQGFDLTDKNDFIKKTILHYMKWMPTPAQMDILYGFLKKNPEIVTNPYLGSEEPRETKQKWEAVTPKLNSKGDGENKSAQFWTAFWAQMRYEIHAIVVNQAKPDPNFASGIMRRLPHRTAERLIALVIITSNDAMTKNEPHSVTQSQDSQQTDVFEDDMKTESTGHHGMGCEPACTCKGGIHVCTTRNSRSSLLNRVMANKEGTNIAQMRKLVKMQKQKKAKITRETNELNKLSDNIDRMTGFITQWGSMVAEDKLRRRNTPN